MKLGLRLQILLLLGGVMLLAFVPLFFAVATYTRLTLQQIREEHARTLGRAIAGHVMEARARRSTAELISLLSAEVGSGGVEAIGVYDHQGAPIARAGEPALVDHLGRRIDPKREAIHEVTTAHGRAIAVVIPDERGAVAAVLRTDDHSARAAPLLRLVGLYTGVVALGTLFLAYFALTYLIVRPLDSLSRSAERVAAGARSLEVPRSAARELAQLALSLRTMTEHLLREEEALRNKVTEVEHATVSLREAQDSLVRSERLASVGRLAAGLAHEIGNPIAALIGLEDLLLQGGLTAEEQQDFLLRMRKETDRINGILGDLLQFARARPAEGSTAITTGNVELAIEDTAALVAPQKSLKGVDLKIDIEPGLPPVALTGEQLVQVVLNLILNAADACDGSGEVRVSAERAGPGVELSVEDTGPGISKSVRDRLFEPFVTTKEIGKGTGLGLAVCRGLVESAGGSIALDTSYTDGARFVVKLPRVTASMPPPGKTTPRV